MQLPTRAAALLLVCAASGYVLAQTPKPNVIYIMLDDLGPGEYDAYNDLNGLGADSKIATPNINALAANGMRFNNAHAATSLCAPTRAVVMSGAPTWQTNTRWGFGSASLRSGQQSVGDLMQAANYRTGLMGKGHLGGDIYQVGSNGSAGKDISNLANMDFDRPLIDGMTQHGYDYTFNMIAGIQARPYFFWENDLATDTDANGVSTRITNANKFDMVRQWNEFYDDGVTEIWEDASGIGSVNWKTRDVPQAMLNKAVDFMDDSISAAPDQPFFLHYNSVAGHWPYVAPEAVQVDINRDGDFDDPRESHNVDGYDGTGNAPDDRGTESMQMVSVSDAEVGVIMQYLEQTDDPRNPGAKLIDNTMIIYTSDNGGIGPNYTNQNGPLDRDEWDVYGHDSTSGLSENKASSREGGHRVPFLVQWKGQIEAGAVRDQRVSTIDLMGTLAGLTGQSLVDQGQGSHNLMPVFVGDQGDSDPVRKNLVVEDTGGASDGNTTRKLYYEDHWKLNLGTDANNPSIFEVFDLAADPAETNNLVSSNDPEVQSRISSMYQNYLVERNASRMAPVFIGRDSTAIVDDLESYGDVAVEGLLEGSGRVSGDLHANNNSIIRIGGGSGVTTESFALTVSEDIRLDDDGDQYNEGLRVSMGRDEDLGLQRSALSFDLTQIDLPEGATAIGAELVLTIGFSWSPAQNGSPTIEVHPLTKDFDETEATWNLASTGDPWNTPGGDFDANTLLAVGEDFNPASVATDQKLTVSGDALLSDVLANLTESDYELLMKYDDASEALGVVNAIWVDSLQNGGEPIELVINYTLPSPLRELTVDGDYIQRVGSTLEMKLGDGMNPGADYDHIDVDGEVVVLGGELLVLLDEGFTPSAGDDFFLFDAAALSGEFDTITTPELPLGLKWDSAEVLATGVLSVVEVLPGDYNDDGVVDAADYSVWRDHVGQPAGSLPNDIDGVEIGQDQFQTWIDNYGRTLADLSALSVPEPSTLFLAGAGLLLFVRAPRRDGV